MSYATIMDLKQMFNRAILEDKFHIIIIIYPKKRKDQLESYCFGQGISTLEVLAELWGGKTIEIIKGDTP